MSDTGTQELKAGRELDALIAQKVFGARVLRDAFSHREWWQDDLTGEQVASRVPRYSTDIADAWRVVEKLATPGFRVDVTLHGSSMADCSWWILADGGGYECLAEECDIESVPLAICLASLASISTKGKSNE